MGELALRKTGENPTPCNYTIVGNLDLKTGPISSTTYIIGQTDISGGIVAVNTPSGYLSSSYQVGSLSGNLYAAPSTSYYLASAINSTVVLYSTSNLAVGSVTLQLHLVGKKVYLEAVLNIDSGTIGITNWPCTIVCEK